MIAINSVVVVLMIEALIALLSLAFGFFLYKRTTKNKEHKAADNLVAKLKKDEAERGKRMEFLIKNNCDIEPAALKKLLQEIITCERSLYQQIIQMFLNRDVQLLTEMDEYVHSLSKPYCKALEQKSPRAINQEDLENAVQLAQKKIDKLNDERTRLADQLQMAMTTMEEISSEYTRMFNGTKNELELNQSCQKMLQVYRAVLDKPEQTGVIPPTQEMQT
jgi:hypothetical protein